jgi:hypothetical protein
MLQTIPEVISEAENTFVDLRGSKPSNG